MGINDLRVERNDHVKITFVSKIASENENTCVKGENRIKKKSCLGASSCDFSVWDESKDH